MSNNLFKGGSQVGFRFLGIDELAEKNDLPVPAVRFMLGILLGFPLAFLYLTIPKHSRFAKNSFISLAGMFICYFCFGTDIVYVLFSILVSYISLVLFGGTIYNVIFAFVFQLGYMFTAYLIYASDGYDVMWTTPQCILCLRLIGLSWDCYDGKQKKEKLSADLQTTCYNGIPTFVEVMGYSLFFGSFMAGPQFSFKRYVKFIDETLVDEEGKKAKNSRYERALERFIAGVVTIVVFLMFDSKYPVNGVLEKEFMEKSFFGKSTQLMLIYHFHFCKYISIWMFCECICIICGLSYNGTKNGKALWDGVCNFKYRKFLFGPFFQDMLESFNINTSQWAGRYVFKRLRFLGNKYASHILTLLFLSLWHGFYIGYIILFAYEFLLLVGERILCEKLCIITDLSYKDLPIMLQLLIRVGSILFRMYSCGYAATAFMLLRWRRIKIVYGALHHWLTIWLLLFYFVLLPILSILEKKKKKKAEKKTE